MADQPSTPTPSIASLLSELEGLSRQHPGRVLRLRGRLPARADAPLPEGAQPGEAMELLIFRGFSSLTTHPTGFDPDQPALPQGTEISGAELLQAPLRQGSEVRLAGPAPVQVFLEASAWA